MSVAPWSRRESPVTTSTGTRESATERPSWRRVPTVTISSMRPAWAPPCAAAGRAGRAAAAASAAMASVLDCTDISGSPVLFA